MVQVLKDQTIVVLGGSAGIGYGAAKQLLETTQANVIIGSSSTKRLKSAIASLSEIESARERITGYEVNLDVSSSEDSISTFFEKVGTLNHLIYTAADSLLLLPITEVTKAAAEKGFGIRYWSLLTTIRLALPRMPKSHESSITITSGTVVFRPMRGWGATGSGVGSAVEGLTRGLAVDLAPIRVNCVAPGAIPETDLWSGMDEKQMVEMLTYLKKRSLTGQLGRAEDVAEAYSYLVRGNFTTGQTLILDGGEMLS